MEIKESNRRLAAILFTDIVGYTTMMQQDEKMALAAVRRHHETLEKCIPLHHGEIYQYYGDGSMNIFNSATDAVHCALSLQKELQRDPVVPVRTGIHIGEIYTESGKVFGDGVNIASRIESIGQGGTVLFSKDVYEKVRNHTEFQMRSIGSFEFKNVHEPLEVYALANPEIRFPDVKAIEGKLKEQGKKRRSAMYISAIGMALAIVILLALYLYPKNAQTAPESGQYKSSIAVLPFANLSENPDEEFLSTGLAEDILTQLAQINGLKVIARTSSMKYKDYEEEGRSLWDISKELGVTNILEGSVRKYGTSLRVTVKLVDPKLENVLWAQEFNHEIQDILKVQRDIAIAVSDRLKVSMSPGLKTRFDDVRSVNAEAYVNYLRGQEVLQRSSGSKDEINQAMEYFKMAINADSTFSKAWIGLADACLESVFWHRATDGEALPKASEAAAMARKLDPHLGEAYGVAGAVYLYSNDLRQAEINLKHALELSPSYPYAYERLAWVYFFTNRPDQGFEMLDRVIQLDPMFTRQKGAVGNGYYMTKRYPEGIAKMNEYLKIHPGDNFILWSLAYLQAANGDYKEAIETLDKRTIGVGKNWVYGYCYGKLGMNAEAKRILDQLIEKQKTDFVPDFMMAAVYLANGDKDNALFHLERASGAGGESFFAWSLSVDPMFAELHNEPRFIAVTERIRKMYTN